MRRENTPGQTSNHLRFVLVKTDNLPESRVLLAVRGYGADTVRKKVIRQNARPTTSVSRNVSDKNRPRVLILADLVALTPHAAQQGRLADFAKAQDITPQTNLQRSAVL